MNAIVPFQFGDEPIRIDDRNGQPWFVLADVCRVLGHTNPSVAARRLDDDEKDELNISDPIGRTQATTVISESGLWSLVLTSRKPAAKGFKKWVTAEVLPSLRRTGSFGAPIEPVLPRDPRALLAYIAQQAGDMVGMQDQMQTLEPKADAYDRLSDAGGSLGVREAAKTLKLGQNELIAWLIQHAWAFRQTPKAPLQGYRSREQSGVVEHRVTRLRQPDGPDKVASSLRITAKGLALIAKALGARA